ncbi:MAG: hypothetical protein NXH95_15835 [Pseudomonadaceae bacterium]|nr:hypothetical protein [Pseudomonadaceae bacterium]
MTPGVDSIGALASELKAQFTEKAELPLFVRVAQAQAHLNHLQENEILMAQIGGNLDGLIDRGGAASARAHLERTQKAEAERNSSSNEFMFVYMLQQIERAIADLDQRIEDMESRFEQLYGETWLEDLAHEILDEIPEQRDGESMEEYQERLKKVLAAEMIGDDGKIKDEYKNHVDPRIRDYARWAKDQYDRGQLVSTRDTLLDPDASDADKETAVSKYTDINRSQEATHLAAKFNDNTINQVAVQKAHDIARDALATPEENTHEALDFDSIF